MDSRCGDLIGCFVAKRSTQMTEISKAATARAIRLSTRRGWGVVAGAFGVMFATFGSAYSFSAFFTSLQQTFQASRGEISLIFSIAVPLYYLVGAISGPIADRFGSRFTCLFGVAIGGAGLVYAATADALWQVYLGFGLGLGLGIGFSFVPSLAAVQRWFVRRRGLASGIAVSGIGLGTLVLPPVATALISCIGWRNAWMVLGIFIVLFGGAAALFIDSSPERSGARADGGIVSLDSAVGFSSLEGFTLREAIRSRPFVLLYLSLVTVWIGASVPFVHLVPYAEDYRLSHGTAVAIFGLVGIGSLAGRFALGGLADRIGRRQLLTAMFVGLALIQFWWLAATNAWQLAIFALVFGACYGGFVALYPAIVVDYFGSRNASGIIGILYTGGAVGSFVGPQLAGDLFDRFGSYAASITLGAASALIAAVLIASASEPVAAPTADHAVR
jgi:MFS family permease